jgi:hypothetical protein
MEAFLESFMRLFSQNNPVFLYEYRTPFMGSLPYARDYAEHGKQINTFYFRRNPKHRYYKLHVTYRGTGAQRG